MDPVRVLVIDEHPSFLDLVVLFLQQEEEVVVVGTAGDLERGLALAAELRPRVAVVDLGTPGLSGLETVVRLRAALPGLGIVATSLLKDIGYRQVALEAGADEFVAKAVLYADLLPAIRQVVGVHEPTPGPTTPQP